jgi:hypothetical protein
LLLAIFPEDQRHGSINYRIGKRFARSLLHLKAVRTVIGSVWGLKKKPGICALNDTGLSNFSIMFQFSLQDPETTGTEVIPSWGLAELVKGARTG